MAFEVYPHAPGNAPTEPLTVPPGTVGIPPQKPDKDALYATFAQRTGSAVPAGSYV
jgi:hypothetical protein